MNRISNQQRQKEYMLQRVMALKLSKQYCTENQLSYEKLRNQRFDLINDIACFSQPSDIAPIGLTNDRDTMPMPTLIIKRVDDDIVIEQTEYTKKYLA